jgi:hypothetical protein
MKCVIAYQTIILVLLENDLDTNVSTLDDVSRVDATS